MKLTIAKTWSVSSWLITLILFSPVVAIFGLSVYAEDSLFSHLWQSVLPDYILNSIKVTLGVVIGSLLLGIPCAWLVANYNFPMRKHFIWLLLLPLALPSYVVAFVFTDLLECAGLVQGFIRGLMPTQSGTQCYFEVRSIGGSIVVLSMVLFPYIYMLARAAFMGQSSDMLNSAKIMGATGWQVFYRVSLPLARPAIIVAMALVAMETLADFAVVKYFAVSTLTTAVYDTWLGYNDLAAAAKISSLMLLFVFSLIYLEKYARRKQKYYQKNSTNIGHNRQSLSGFKRFFALLFLFLVFALSFLLPFSALLIYALDYFAQSWNAKLFELSANSFLVACIVGVLCLLIGLVLVYFKRLSNTQQSETTNKLSSTGYALPGTVLAIGVLIPLSYFDGGINQLFAMLGLTEPGLILSGSLFAIIFAYTVRFAAIAIGAVESGLSKISPSLDMASITMGYSPLQTMIRVHFPLVKKSLLVAFVLVFVECMKELPAALLVRPFGFETLATYVFQYVSDEQLEVAALPALLIVFVSLVPVIFLNKLLEKES